MKLKKILVLSLDEARAWLAKVRARELAEKPEVLLNELLNGGVRETVKFPDEIAQVFVDGDLGAELAAEHGAEAVGIEIGDTAAVEMEMDKLTVVWVDESGCSQCSGRGYIPSNCLRCSGEPRIPGEHECDVCGGHGHVPVPCPTCKGKR